MLRKAFYSLFFTTLTVHANAQTDLPQEVADGFYVTLQEVRENSRETFNAFAGPDGGPISKEEFVSPPLPPKIGPSGQNPEMLERLFGALDADGDGQLTRAEWNQQIQKDLSFADEDENGRITLTELANARENMGIGDALGMIF